MDLMRKIQDEIERVAIAKGVYFPGEESVTATLNLSENEKQELLNMDFEEYYWYELENNQLTITYCNMGEV